MKRLGFVILLTLIVHAVGSPGPNAGVVFEIETKDHGHAPPRVHEIEEKVEGPNLAIAGMPGDGTGSGGAMIFRGDRGENGEMVVVDHGRKGYYVMDGTSIKAMTNQVDAAMKEMEKAFENLPEKQRKMMENMLSKIGPNGTVAGPMNPRPKPQVKKTGERGTKQGYPCVKYEVFRDGRKIRDVWTTDWDNIDGGDEVADAFRGMGAFFEALRKAMPTLPGGGDPFGGRNPFDETNFENGFPVVVTGYGEDGGVESEARLKGTRRQRIDPAAFEPPSGYKRMSMGPN